jgi:hypothetical protein
MVAEYMRQISNCVDRRPGPEMRMREEIKAKDCVWNDTHVLTFIFKSSKPLIIFLVNLMVYLSGPLVNHLFDGSP